jgi:hypothetical protein
MKRLLLACLIVVAWPSAVWAVCTGASPTWTAASVALADVQACVTAASNGDTINLPPGTEAWAAGITVNKQVSIVGATAGCPDACDDATVIQTSTHQIFAITKSNVRIAQITFEGAGNGSGVILFNGGGAVVTSNGRVDHCHFKDLTTGEAINVGALPTVLGNGGDIPVLVDHNLFTATSRFKMLEVYGHSVTTHGGWDDALDLGGSSFAFAEANVVTYTTLVDGTSGMLDASAGGSRFVFRFNTVTNGDLYTHGMEAQDPSGTNAAMWASAQAWEIYNNTTTFTVAHQFTINHRGGTGVIFSNTFNGIPSGYAAVRYYYERGDGTTSCQDVDPPVACQGVNTYDGNEASKWGYPCYHQPGTTGADGITTMPVYQWGNTYWEGGTGEYAYTSVTHDDATCHYQHVQEARDIMAATSGLIADLPVTCTVGDGYWATDEGEWNSEQAGVDGRLYKCTAANTWTLYYTPFTYPHPLSGTPTGPTDEYIAANGTATPDLHWTHADTSSQFFRVLVDGAFSKSIVRTGASGYTTTLPTLAVGKHLIVVQTCNGQGCTAGTQLQIVKM